MEKNSAKPRLEMALAYDHIMLFAHPANICLGKTFDSKCVANVMQLTRYEGIAGPLY